MKPILCLAGSLLSVVLSVGAVAEDNPPRKRDVWIKAPVPKWARHTIVAMDAGTGDNNENILAPSCEYPISPARMEGGATNLPAFTGKFSDRAVYIKDLLGILGGFPVSVATAKKFLPLFESSTIPVQLVTQEVLARRGMVGAAALCEHIFNAKNIYIDKTAEVGEVIPIFFHELTHCVDDELDKNNKKMSELMLEALTKTSELVNQVVYKKNVDSSEVIPSDLSPEDIKTIQKLKRRVQQFDQIRSFRTERRAYDAEHILAKGLLEKYKPYYASKGRIQTSFLLPHKDEFIIERYGLNADWIAKLKSGKCETPQ
jgi:hypothetical protein